MRQDSGAYPQKVLTVNDTQETEQRGKTPSGSPEAKKTDPQQAKKKSTSIEAQSWKRRIVKWLAVSAVVLMALFFSVRWVGTTTYRGTVQRVYEKGAEYRVEFAELGGSVRVVGNSEIRFPYLKVNTADVHAELNRLSETGDIIDIRVWGLRQAWFDMFPNVVDIEFVRSDSDRRRAKAEKIADEVMKALTKREVLKGGEDVRADVIGAIEKGMRAPEIVEKTQDKK